MKINGHSQKLRSFLYRRLARWVTCEVRLLGQHSLALDSKFQANSLQDVFCHPFYWQLFNWLPQQPNLVVDLGAHCGHFSMLADICFRTQFPAAVPEYVLVEPNPELVKVARVNLRRSGLCPRNVIHCGLVGRERDGSATLWVSPRNYLSASLNHSPKTRGVSADFFDLETLVKNRPVDLLKIDIEGAEFDFVEGYHDLLRRTSAVMIEVHAAPERSQQRLYAQMGEAGLRLKADPLGHGDADLVMFQRW